VLVATACQAAPADPGAEAAIAAAAGLPAAVSFRSEGSPLDEPALPDGTLTLVAAAARALATDAALQAALARVRSALADAEQARLLANPLLSVVARFGQGGPDLEATLSQDLVQALLVPHRTAAADQRLRKAAADAVSVALDVLAELQTSYAVVQASDALVPLLSGRHALLQQLVDLTRLRAQNGEVAEIDVTALDAQRLEVAIDLEVAQREQREHRLHLARLLGEPSGTAAWPLEPPAEVPARLRPVDECVRIALQQRPEAQAGRLQILALGGDLAAAGIEPFLGGSTGVAAEQQGNDWLVGPTFSLPLPLFDTGSARKHRLSADTLAARQDLAATERRIVEEVRTAGTALGATVHSLGRVTGELVPRQRLRRDQAEFAYRSGHTDLTPLLLAEDDLRSAEAKAIDFRRQAASALYRLQRAIGGPGALNQPSPPAMP
jgi:cobalt-zinc-cadmium efflux system outer membrane protein